MKTPFLLTLSKIDGTPLLVLADGQLIGAALTSIWATLLQFSETVDDAAARGAIIDKCRMVADVAELVKLTGVTWFESEEAA
jgi:hypothetical protein